MKPHKTRKQRPYNAPNRLPAAWPLGERRANQQTFSSHTHTRTDRQTLTKGQATSSEVERESFRTTTQTKGSTKQGTPGRYVAGKKGQIGRLWSLDFDSIVFLDI